MARVVIVAGASGGLGSAIASQFASEGNQVVLNYSRSKQDAEQLAKSLAKAPGQTMLYQADVRNSSQVKGMVEATVKKWGRVDVLVNATGAIPRTLEGTPIVDMPDEEWQLYIDTDLKGTFHLLKAVAPQMTKQKDGHIIVIGAGLSFHGHPGWAGYMAAKAGLASLCRVAAQELGSHNIKVNVVEPGPVEHPRIAHVVSKEVISHGTFSPSVLPQAQTPEEFASFISTLSKLQGISGQLFFLESRIIW